MVAFLRQFCSKQSVIETVCLTFVFYLCLTKIDLNGIIYGTETVLDNSNKQSDNLVKQEQSKSKAAETIQSEASHPYSFTGPPYSGYTDDQITVVENVCVEYDPAQKANKIVVYKYNGPPTRRVRTYGYSKGFYVYWPILTQESDPPPEHRMMKQPAFFIKQHLGENLFHFFEDGLRGLFPLMELTGRLHQPEGNHVFTFDCDGHLKDSPYVEMFYKMSENMSISGCIRESEMTNVCFPHGVFGFVRNVNTDRDRFFDNIKKGYDLLDHDCGSKPRILFLDRKYRRVLNVEELANATRALGIDNTIVEIKKFEGMTKREQMKQIHCTTIFIGVHGAGMEWYQFLQSDAAVFELGWYRWRANQWWDLARRRGLLAEKMEAGYNVTINWKFTPLGKYANLTEEQKNEYINESRDVPDWNGRNPYKNADAIFDVPRFLKKIQDLMNQIESNYGTRFRSA